MLSRFHFVDQFPVVAVVLVRPLLLAEGARAVELTYSVWGTICALIKSCVGMEWVLRVMSSIA